MGSPRLGVHFRVRAHEKVDIFLGARRAKEACALAGSHGRGEVYAQRSVCERSKIIVDVGTRVVAIVAVSRNS